MISPTLIHPVALSSVLKDDGPIATSEELPVVLRQGQSLLNANNLRLENRKSSCSQRTTDPLTGTSLDVRDVRASCICETAQFRLSREGRLVTHLGVELWRSLCFAFSVSPLKPVVLILSHLLRIIKKKPGTSFSEISIL